MPHFLSEKDGVKELGRFCGAPFLRQAKDAESFYAVVTLKAATVNATKLFCVNMLVLVNMNNNSRKWLSNLSFSNHLYKELAL